VCQPNRVRVVEGFVDAESEQAAVIAAGTESIEEQGD
jgi:hypothetical protein